MNLTADSPRTWWWLYAASAISLLTTLALPYIGEEAVYTITSLEMRLNHDFFVTTLYGTNYGRPPLINWLIIPLAEIIGWDRMLLASRLVTALSTVVTGLVLAWLTQNLTRNRGLAAFSAAVFLSGDVLFYRGWLAYADSPFSAFVFGAIACLWVAVLRQQTALLWVAMLCLAGGFLVKVPTAYLFYGIAAGVLCFERDARRVLLSPQSIAAHACALAVPVIWNVYFTRGVQSNTAFDIILKLKTLDIGDYLNQLWWFPLETALRLLPLSAVLGWYWWRQRRTAPVALPAADFPWRSLIAILILNYLPYWLGPKSNIRYVMPLYPLAALLFAAAIWRYGERPLAVATRWLAGAIALKLAIGLWLFPWYQQTYRGDYAATAKRIESATHGYPLYTTDVSATGLSVSAHLDSARYPGPYIRQPPEQWDNGFVLSYTADPQLGRVSASYALGRDALYLLCRGEACGVVSPPAR